jgi:hypothetical protein
MLIIPPCCPKWCKGGKGLLHGFFSFLSNKDNLRSENPGPVSSALRPEQEGTFSLEGIVNAFQDSKDMIGSNQEHLGPMSKPLAPEEEEIMRAIQDSNAIIAAEERFLKDIEETQKIMQGTPSTLFEHRTRIGSTYAAVRAHTYKSTRTHV